MLKGQNNQHRRKCNKQINQPNKIKSQFNKKISNLIQTKQNKRQNKKVDAVDFVIFIYQNNIILTI
jgi:hypothetical protein